MSGYNYTCDICELTEFAGHPHYKDDDIEVCLECAVEYNYITKEEYMKNGFYNEEFDDFKYFDLVIKDSSLFKNYCSFAKSKYEVVDIRKPKYTDKRNCLEYQNWRTSVFKRDEYTCQHCKKVGGELNAHHIKSYKDFKKLRYDIDNGITLCINCHRKEHKRLRGVKNGS